MDEDKLGFSTQKSERESTGQVASKIAGVTVISLNV